MFPILIKTSSTSTEPFDICGEQPRRQTFVSPLTYRGPSRDSPIAKNVAADACTVISMIMVGWSTDIESAARWNPLQSLGDAFGSSKFSAGALGLP